VCQWECKNGPEDNGAIAVGYELKAVGTGSGDISFGVEAENSVLLGLGKVAGEDGHDGQDSQGVCAVGCVDIYDIAFWIEYLCEFVDGDSGAEAELQESEHGVDRVRCERTLLLGVNMPGAWWRGGGER
jgi:hypothetical protein